jgi:hypothetical protein
MKSSKKSLLTAAVVGGLLISSTSVFGQNCPANAACTDPVGFTTIPVTNGIGLIGLNLVPAVEFQGVGNGGTNPEDIDVTNGAAALAGLDLSVPHYVEVTGGPNAGLNSTIAAINGGTITLEDVLPGDLGADYTVVVRRHWTLATVFGATEGDLIIAPGTVNADRIWVFNSNGTFTKYFYQTSFTANEVGWREVDGSLTDSKANTILYYTDGFVLQRRGDTIAEGLKLLGAVNVDATTVAVLTGLNLIGNFYPAPDGGATLAELFGATEGELTITPGTVNADRIWLIKPDGTFDKYFYQTSFTANEVGWRLVGGSLTVNQADVQVALGTSFVLQRIGLDVSIPFVPTFAAQ